MNNMEAKKIAQKSLRQSLLEECYAMVTHLAANGKKIPTVASVILSSSLEDCVGKLTISDDKVLEIHNTLSKSVAPARPKTLWLVIEEVNKGNTYKLFSSVGLIRRLMITAVISLLLFVILSLSGHINGKSINNTIFAAQGLELFYVLFFFIASAALGAVFGSLFQANKYIVENTFDPKYESSYWIRIVLGIIAGFLLAILIPIPEGGKGNMTNIHVFSKPLLAMLGGFSSSLVYRILFRLVYALESVFIGKKEDALEEETKKMQIEKELELEQQQQNFNGKLNDLRGVVTSENDIQSLKDKLNTAIQTSKATN